MQVVSWHLNCNSCEIVKEMAQYGGIARLLLCVEDPL